MLCVWRRSFNYLNWFESEYNCCCCCFQNSVEWLVVGMPSWFLIVVVVVCVVCCCFLNHIENYNNCLFVFRFPFVEKACAQYFWFKRNTKKKICQIQILSFLLVYDKTKSSFVVNPNGIIFYLLPCFEKDASKKLKHLKNLFRQKHRLLFITVQRGFSQKETKHNILDISG